MNTIPKNMIACSVEHKYAGNLWAVVATYPGGWAHITSLIDDKKNQFFLVWTKLLTPEKGIDKSLDEKTGNVFWKKSGRDIPLEPEVMSRINQIRDDLSSGRKIIKDTRLVNA